jgi:hypothetical protein
MFPSLQHVWIWPLLSVLAYVSAAFVMLALDGEGREMIAIGSVGLTIGAITGIGMAWLLGQQSAAVEAPA